MIKTETINYAASDTNFIGTICYDPANSAPKPGILVVHTYKGHSDFEVSKAFELAKLGYVGFAVDMFGGGFHTDDVEEARRTMYALNGDRPLLLKRIRAALDALRNHPQVDEKKLGGIGFCFGGKCLLDLVRANADIRGIASFHGVYDKPPMQNEAAIDSSILILHGWDDPLGTPSQLVELAAELTARNADWQILAFGHTGHSFTNPQVNSPENGMAFQRLSDKRAWQSMENFFAEIFA